MFGDNFSCCCALGVPLVLSQWKSGKWTIIRYGRFPVPPSVSHPKCKHDRSVNGVLESVGVWRSCIYVRGSIIRDKKFQGSQLYFCTPAWRSSMFPERRLSVCPFSYERMLKCQDCPWVFCWKTIRKIIVTSNIKTNI